MKAKEKVNLLTLVEASIMIALSTVLSVVPLFEMPYGGSITLASFLPVVIIAYRHGMKTGIATATVASLIQMLLGMKNFSYFTTAGSIIALAVFDYIIAFAVFGLAGIFRRVINNQAVSLLAGAGLASAVRYVCHVISGATVWAGLSIPTEAALVYSLSYNATYMVPETVILLLSAAYIGSAIDFRTKMPARIKSERLDAVASWLVISAGLVALAALVADTVLVFSKLQNYASGEFMILGLADVNWLAVGLITLAAVLVVGVLIVLASKRVKRA